MTTKSRRNKKAYEIISGASNPTAIVGELARTFKELTEAGLDTSEQCSDPAIRAMVFQLAHLTKTFEMERDFRTLDAVLMAIEEGNDHD